jgi:ribosomal protein S18 acetylase RimI-like enzyme
LYSKDSEYNIRLFESGDEEAIVELIKISYPEWRDAESPLDYWKWKYIDNPFGSIVVVADWDSKIVGIKHRLFLNIKVDEKTSSSYGDDSTVHPDYRRKGIYKKMVRYSEELSKENNIILRYGIQIHEAAVIMAEHEGFILFPYSISHMLQIRDVKMHFRKRPTKNNLAARYGFSMLKLLNRIKNTVKYSQTQSEIKMIDISKFDENINTFWQNIKNGYNFIIEKNQRYLNWRYCDPRSSLKGRYLIKQAELDGEILGFIVIKTRSKDGYSEGYVVDLLVLPDRMDVARKLLVEACLFFRESDINVVHYRVVKNHPYQALFSEQGFIDVPSKMHMTYMSQDKEKTLLIKDSKPSQIHFNYGDCH